MAEYQQSSQLNLWLFQSPKQLQEVRIFANTKAGKFLTENHAKDEPQKPPVEHFACGYSQQQRDKDFDMAESTLLETSPNGHAYLNPEEETTLISFYIDKLPALIGPSAQVHRLRRDLKVTATAALLTRRFFLSNSVMMFDPKCVMVAAAFLAAKVEDVTADVRYLEQGTEALQAPVAAQDIISYELQLLSGCHFDLLCFHPFKPLSALTEDLRTYLKSDKGKNLVHVSHGDGSPTSNNEGNSSSRLLSSNDLRPIYETARTLLEKVVLSDVPLLYSPAQVALASLMVAQEQVLAASSTLPNAAPQIDFLGYLNQRFDDQMLQNNAQPNETVATMAETLRQICDMLRTFQHTPATDMGALKTIHKKLKKVRWWGKESKKSKKKEGDTIDGEVKAKKQKIA
ncbi:hypothetical protein MPSEU_000012600 [Mayamaea pseudoterrestris]|nr:hypothetical protein MPSEU_000012600 [Mayamaea pseudoterrestris]